MPPYIPRLNIDLRQDQKQKLIEIFPHGAMKPYFHALIDSTIALYDKHGYEAIGAIVSKHISVEQLARHGSTYTQEHSEN